MKLSCRCHRALPVYIRFALSYKEWWVSGAHRNYPGLEESASPNIRSFPWGNLEFRDLSPRRYRSSALCKSPLDRALYQDGQGTLAAHPMPG